MRKGLCIFILMLLGGSSCVIAPLDGETIATRATEFSVIGLAQNPDALVRIFARNHTAGGVFEQVGSIRSSTNPIEDETLYGFNKKITLAHKYWDPSGVCSASTGMANLEVREDGSDLSKLYTFTEAGINCLNAAYSSGSTWVQAGVQCQTGTSITLFTHQCN